VKSLDGYALSGRIATHAMSGMGPDETVLLDRQQRTSDLLQPDVLFIPGPVGPPLHQPDVVIQTFDETQGPYFAGLQ
jgi:hypothetical protein